MVRLKLTFNSGEATFCPGEQIFGRNDLIHAEKTNPLQELMRDLCTGVYNKDLREILFGHYKEDGKTPYTFEEQLARAKSLEAAHNTNIIIMHSATSKVEEQVNRLITNSLRCKQNVDGVEVPDTPARIFQLLSPAPTAPIAT